MTLNYMHQPEPVKSAREAMASYIANRETDGIADSGDLLVWVYNTIFDELMESAPGELERRLNELMCES